MEILQKTDPLRPGTQGQWNRHWSISYLWLPTSILQ